MAGLHSPLPPSGAAAWVNCAMWPAMNLRFPQDDTPESREGNAAHWVVAQMLAGTPITLGMPTPFSLGVTEEMIEGAQLFVNTVRKYIPQGTPLYVEQPVAIPAVHKECWGTPDLWALIDNDTLTLELIDYKFGHLFVDEFDNWQCVAYYSGILANIAKMLGRGAGEIDQELTVNIRIVQPRCFYKGDSVRTWTFIGSDIRGRVNQLANAAAKVYDPINGITATTNPECEHCPGRHACSALQLAAYHDAEFAVQSAPVELTAEAASLELRMLERARDRLNSRVEGLQEYVKSCIRSGKQTPYHRVEQGYGRANWTVPIAQVVALGQMMNIDLTKPGVKTPKQAQDAGIDGNVIKAYSLAPPGELKLIPVNPSDARRVFGNSN